MNAATKHLVFLSLFLFFAVGCHELGHVDGPANYGSVSQDIVGEIQYVDTRTSEIEIRSESGRVSNVRYDGRTQVVYQRRNYSVSNLEPGDTVAVRIQSDRDGRLYTDLVTVREDAHDRVYRGANTLLRGTVQRSDPRYSSIMVETGDRRQVSFYYDTRTRTQFRNRDYRPQDIQSGDYINVRTRDGSKDNPTAEVINVMSRAQDGAGSNRGDRLDRLDGRVEYVDTRRGTFEIRGQNNRLIVVNIPYNPPRSVSDRFNRLRDGDNVRVEGRFVNQDRFELESFL
jgi:hypothetical protein